ncbi:hypothetical protein CLU79DRAFT_757881 [Phycomyces nitens]|nr:hypothetical protein CLU79DRAFT_757881 [Phycomyces nitens]
MGKKHSIVKPKSKQANGSSGPKPHSASNSTTTNSNSNNAPPWTWLQPNTPLRSQLASEQRDLVKSLDAYIIEFNTKTQKLKNKPLEIELVVLFVMNLHPRWKRLVEPMEYLFNSWTEAAKAARHHAVKVSAMLGVERTDSLEMFQGKEARELLQSGYFVPGDHPSRNPTTETLPDSNKRFEKDKFNKRLLESILNPQPEESILSTAQPRTKEAVMEGRVEFRDDCPPKDEQEKQNPSAETGLPIIMTKTSSVSHTTIIERTLENQMEYNPDFYRAQYNPYSLCYYIPIAHRHVNLGFLELELNGKRFEGMLAKKRWEGSAMSIVLQERLGLELDRSLGFDIRTEFGHIEETIGAVEFPVVHPSDRGLCSQMLVQVMPMIYGGQVDLVLGTDFFYLFHATFNVEDKIIRFMGKDARFSIKVLS